MPKKITQKQLKHDEFVEAAFDFGHWLEEHWRSVLTWVGSGVLVALVIVTWFAWSRRNVEQAGRRLAEAIAVYEQAQAVGFSDGTALAPALATFEEVSSSMDGRPPGRLAQFYRGATLYHLGRLDEARASLEQVAAQSEASDTVVATALWMLARAEVASGQEEAALARLEALAESADAAVPPEQALLEIGRIHESAGRREQARTHWQRVIEQYPQSPSAAEARTLLQ